MTDKTEVRPELIGQARKLRPAIFDGLNAAFTRDQWDVIERGMAYFAKLQIDAFAQSREAPPIVAAEKIRLYTEATKLAMKLGQAVGPKNEYYVTLRQLEGICKGEAHD
jgi:hypothetical protein